MGLTTAFFALLLGSQDPASADTPQGIRCIYDTVGSNRMQSYDAQIGAKTLSIEQFADATAADRRACIQRGVWQHQQQIDISFSFALSMAQFVSSGDALQKGGINPDDVLGQWDKMPTALRAALKMGTKDYPGGDDKFVQDMRAFLSSETPAKEPPHRGRAFILLSEYGTMLRLNDEYEELSKPKP